MRDNMTSVTCGAPSAELIESIVHLKPAELREVDFEELLDAARVLQYSDSQIAREFGTLLCCFTGLGSKETKTYTLWDDTGKYPLFVATLKKGHQLDGVATLCGFATTRGEQLLDSRDRYEAIHDIFSQIVIDMQQARMDVAVCHVKASNRQTLTMWRYLSKWPDVKVSITDDPFTKLDYKLVTININYREVE